MSAALARLDRPAVDHQGARSRGRGFAAWGERPCSLQPPRHSRSSRH